MSAAARSAGGGIDLPADIQRELRDLESRGDALSYYRLLGLTADVDSPSIRRAYLEQSKRFHPDAWYRRDLGEFGPLLTKWFQRMAAAYEVLSDEETRSAYDREHLSELSETDRLAVEQRALSRAEQDRREVERRARLLRTKGFARVGAARSLYEQSLTFALNGERMHAIGALKAARELDPNRKEISARLVELEREQAKARAASALLSGREREVQQNWAGAQSAYVNAFQLDARNASAALGAARSASAAGDAQTAATWAARAVEIQPDDIGSRLLLAKLLAAQALKTRARAELKIILDKVPDHKEARALLKGL